jgi:hypothetical protein
MTSNSIKTSEWNQGINKKNEIKKTIQDMKGGLIKI